MSSYSSKLLGAGKQSCVPVTWFPIPALWGVRLLMVMLKKSERHSSDSCLGEKEPDTPSQVASLPQLPCLSLPHLQRGEGLFSLAGRVQPDLEPSQALWQSPSHHRPHCTPSAPRALSDCAPSCWPVTDCTASLRHTAFPEPLEKRHSHVKYPEVLYHLIVLLITNFSSISSLLNWGCLFRQQTQRYTDILSYPAQAQFKPTIPVSHLCYGNKDTMEEVHCHKRLTGKRPAGPAVPSHLLYSSSLNACSSTQRRPNVWDTWRLRGHHGTWGTMQRQIEEHATGSVLNEKRETLYTGKCAMVCCSPSSNLICTFWIRRIGKSWKH